MFFFQKLNLDSAKLSSNQLNCTFPNGSNKLHTSGCIIFATEQSRRISTLYCTLPFSTFCLSQGTFKVLFATFKVLTPKTFSAISHQMVLVFMFSFNILFLLAATQKFE